MFVQKPKPRHAGHNQQMQAADAQNLEFQQAAQLDFQAHREQQQQNPDFREVHEGGFGTVANQVQQITHGKIARQGRQPQPRRQQAGQIGAPQPDEFLGQPRGDGLHGIHQRTSESGEGSSWTSTQGATTTARNVA